MVLLIVIMLIPIVGLYFYTNKTNTGVLGEELNRSVTSQLAFFQSEVDSNIELLGLWPNLLIQDPDILSLKDIFDYQQYLDLDTITLAKRVQSKLKIQESSSNWQTRIFIYSPVLERVVTSDDVAQYDHAELQSRVKPGWQVMRSEAEGKDHYTFSLVTAYPYSAWIHPEEAQLLIEVRFDSQSIQNMLDQFKSDGPGDPLYYNREAGVIYNRSANLELSNRIVDEVNQNVDLQAIENETVDVDGKPYMVNMVSSATGWYLIDYMPMSDIVKPIQATNRLFYISVGALLLMSLIAAYLLYAQVQVPLKQLVQSFQKLKNGDYSVRIQAKGNSEFGFVFQRFNSMVEEIQDLIEKIFLEKIHVREARLKQLQSQINPHFFYNCFSFISSMAKLKNHQAVIAMSENLSKYYRYTTRQERDFVRLSEELDFVTNYLEIQRMRRNSLEYEIDIPARMKKLDIPPLVLQPLVENAVLHGIEASNKAGRIRIQGECQEYEMKLIVEDNGIGLGELEREALLEKLCRPMDEEMGCGLWNVHQRMLLRFGENAGLSFSDSELGGLKVSLTWRWTSEQERNEGGEA